MTVSSVTHRWGNLCSQPERLREELLKGDFGHYYWVGDSWGGLMGGRPEAPVNSQAALPRIGPLAAYTVLCCSLAIQPCPAATGVTLTPVPPRSPPVQCTKLANCVFGYELQRRLGARGVQVG